MQASSFLTLIGLVIPPIIDLINRKVSDPDLRFWVSLGICALFGFGISVLQDGMPPTIEGVSAQVLMVFGLAQIAYKGLWEKSSQRKDLRLVGGSEA